MLRHSCPTKRQRSCDLCPKFKKKDILWYAAIGTRLTKLYRSTFCSLQGRGVFKTSVGNHPLHSLGSDRLPALNISSQSKRKRAVLVWSTPNFSKPLDERTPVGLRRTGPSNRQDSGKCWICLKPSTVTTSTFFAFLKKENLPQWQKLLFLKKVQNLQLQSWIPACFLKNESPTFRLILLLQWFPTCRLTHSRGH